MIPILKFSKFISRELLVSGNQSLLLNKYLKVCNGLWVVFSYLRIDREDGVIFASMEMRVIWNFRGTKLDRKFLIRQSFSEEMMETDIFRFQNVIRLRIMEFLVITIFREDCSEEFILKEGLKK